METIPYLSSAQASAPFPCSLPGLGSLSPGAAARGSLLSQPEPPLHTVTPADALWTVA